MDSEAKHVETLIRIAQLEAKLAAAVDKVNTLVDDIKEKYENLDGDAKTPSIISRVIQLERAEATVKWALGILYVTLAGALAKYIGDKL